MKQLIKVNPEGRTTAKELYEFLGLRAADYSRWCKANITDNEFAEESTDYGLFRTDADNQIIGRPTQNYWLTIPFAKKLCMISKSDRGEQARDYFIEVERKFIEQRTFVHLPDFTNPAVAARAWADEVEAKQIAEASLAIAAPKAEAWEAVAEDESVLWTFEQASKIAALPGLTARTMREMALENGWMLKGKNEPSAHAVRDGLMRIVYEPIMNGRKIVPVPKIRPKAFDFMVRQYKQQSGRLW